MDEMNDDTLLVLVQELRYEASIADAGGLEHRAADLLEQMQKRIEELDLEVMFERRANASEFVNDLLGRIEKLEKQNTFWACKNHKNQSTLRCAICDEQHIKKLEAREQ